MKRAREPKDYYIIITHFNLNDKIVPVTIDGPFFFSSKQIRNQFFCEYVHDIFCEFGIELRIEYGVDYVDEEGIILKEYEDNIDAMQNILDNINTSPEENYIFKQGMVCVDEVMMKKKHI
jgi:hypothetical protein